MVKKESIEEMLVEMALSDERHFFSSIDTAVTLCGAITNGHVRPVAFCETGAWAQKLAALLTAAAIKARAKTKQKERT